MKFKHIIGTVIILGGVIVIGLFGWSYSNNEGDGSAMYQTTDNVTVNTTKREDSEPESVGDYKERLPKSENVDLESDVDIDELNYAISEEVSEGREYQDLGYSDYSWVNYVSDLYVTENTVIVLTATQELDYLEDYDKVEVIKEIQKVVGVKQFVLSDEDIYGNLPISVYNNMGELIAESSYEAPRDIELY